MRHIVDYNLFESAKPVVSFDFDGVLHRSVKDIHPISFDKPSEWTPFDEMFSVMREEAKNNRIVIVTARDNCDMKHLWEFVRMHGLPVEKIYCTNNGPKLDTLKYIKAVRHYDDNPKVESELRNSGIEFVKVDPVKGEYAVMEHVQGGKGSLILIKGKKLDNGKQYLYAVPIKGEGQFARYKKDDKYGKPTGKPSNMVYLGDELYRLVLENGDLKAKKVAYYPGLGQNSFFDKLGLPGKTKAVTRNENKTPLHWETIKYDMVQKMVNELGASIKAIPDIDWDFNIR